MQVHTRRTALAGAIRGLAELVRYRELVVNLVVRDLKLRYRHSVLGFLWCLLNPLLMMTVFTVVFTVMLPDNRIERYPIFILVGILAWQLHQTALMGAIHSVVANAHLVQKVYFPREVLPISVVLANTVNFLLALLVIFPIIFIEGGTLTGTLAFLPLVVLNQVIFTLGVALFLAAINVFYRDTGIIMETVIQAWFFLTPILYRIEDLLPSYARAMYILNPPASFIASYRDILYYGGMTNLDFFLRTSATSVVVLVVGYLCFRSASRHFSEAL
ncbi:MAG: ABC transporter permease [Chloroflexi bacterium]|nr:ABC transporter permease [Chloroflexota bacterium]